MALGAAHQLRLDGRVGWQAARLEAVELSAQGLVLRSQPARPRRLADALGRFSGLALPTGVALDARGGVYALDGETLTIKRYDPCTEVFETLPCIGGEGSAPRRLRAPHGIAISGRGDLYVADTGNRRVQVFALKSLALRGISGPIRGVQGLWEPWGIAVSHQGCIYVSDHSNGLVRVFDPNGHPLAAYDGAGGPDGALARPTHIALDREGRVYLVQEGRDYVTVLGPDGLFERVVERPEEVAGAFCPTAIGVDDKGRVYITDRVSGRLYVRSTGPEACGCAVVERAAQDCAALAFDAAGRAWLADAGGHCVQSLDTDGAFALDGTFISEALDSRLYRCEWHSVCLRAVVPAGTWVRIDTLTSEAPLLVAEVAELPAWRWATGLTRATVGEGEWDCLVLSPPGRYLWLRLTLHGEGGATPCIDWVRLDFPRASSLQYLPAVFSEDPASRDFLARFLSIFDAIHGETRALVGGIARYLDPAGTPAEPGRDFLAWLASWVGLALDRHWPEARRRALLRHAHRLYALRGTPEGLRLHVRLYTGFDPHIVEHFRLRRWLYLGQGRLGARSEPFGAAVVKRLQLDELSRIGEFQLVDSGDPLRDPFHHHAHRFSVFITLPGGGTELTRQTLARIVEMARPAHTVAELRVSAPGFQLGMRAFLGVDSVLGDYPEGVTAGRLGQDTVLGPSRDEAAAPTLRLGLRSRIGSSTRLD